ncbi:MAG: phosphate/phosphite/phosphonate ABC transporter substrate-binding protein [Lachnospiraceae bacterium]
MKKILISGILMMTIALSVLMSGCSNKAEKVLNVAVMPALEGESVDAQKEAEVNEDLRQALEEELGMTVKLYESTEYSVGITALAEGNIDVLLVSPMSYYQASLQADIEPLVTYSSAPGTAVYKSVFITAADNEEINSLEDLEGKTFAFVDQASSSGYLYPKYTLVDTLGLDAATLENAGTYFESVTFSGSHQNSIISVLNGGVDAAPVAYGVLDYIPSLLEGKTVEDVKIVGETAVIPNPLFVVRTDLEEDIREQLRQAYLSYDNSTYFEVIFGNSEVRFTEADDSALADAENVVTTLGIEAE